MSILETVSPYPSPYDKKHHLEQDSMGITYTATSVMSKLSPNVIYSSSNSNKHRRLEPYKYGSSKYNSVYDLIQNYMKDPSLAKYIKVPETKITLNTTKICLNKKETNLGNEHEVLRKYFRSRNEDVLRIESLSEVELFRSKNYKYNDSLHVSTKTTSDNSPEINTKPTSTNVDRAKFSEPISHKSDNYPKETSSSYTNYLPGEFLNCPLDDLISLITRMLQSLISINDKLVPDSITSESTSSENNLLTRYHSRVPPGISTTTYLGRLTKFNNFKPATLLTTIYYIDLLSHHYQPFFTLNSWTVHRFLLVATMVSQKSMEDFFYTNDHYAKVGGVALNELNCLELDFLTRVEWKCVPAKQLSNGTSSIKFAKEVLDLYYHQLVGLMGKVVSKNDQSIYVFEPKSDHSSKPNSMQNNGDCDDDFYDDDDEDNSEGNNRVS